MTEDREIADLHAVKFTKLNRPQIRVVTGKARVRGDGALIVRIAPRGTAGSDPREATIGIGIADRTLARSITESIAKALGNLELPATPCPVIRLRSRKRLARIAEQLAGAIVIVRVTERNARHLVVLLDGIRAAGAAAVQFVWDGATGAERHVFAALERARANPAAAPAVLATTDEPVAALRVLVAHRSRRTA